MKLLVSRSQIEQTDRRGRVERVEFGLSCRLELEQQEIEIVERYGRTTYPITQINVRGVDPRESVISLARLREGISIKTSFVGDAQGAESAIKEGCSEFKALLVSLQTYGGNEEIEY